jgi:septum formation protein
MTSPTPRLILASTSPYRKSLLERLNLPFYCIPSNVDETSLQGESSSSQAIRLAHLKALKVWRQHPDSVVIGSDQVADLDGQRLTKPGKAERAIEQLQACSGRNVEFYTAVTILAPDGLRHDHLDLTRVSFRDLGSEEIQRYVSVDSPLNCAGSFKAEALGISLFTGIHNQDPTALTGLPLIWVSQCLRELGFPNP